LGLTATYEERTTGNAALVRKDYTWTSDNNSKPYISAVTTTLNPGTGDAAASKVSQSLDDYGNISHSYIRPVQISV
jgi:hypothetical protein